MAKNNETKKIAVVALVGAALGAIGGLLFAPQSGKETREDIKNAAKQTKAETEKQLKKLYEDLEQQIAHAKELAGKLKGKAHTEISDASEMAGVAADKVKSLLTAVRTGDASDKDLQKAVSDAKAAKDHLSKFLKK